MNPTMMSTTMPNPPPVDDTTSKRAGDATDYKPENNSMRCGFHVLLPFSMRPLLGDALLRRQLLGHLVVLLDRWQGFLRCLFQIGILAI
jgi:hypothetical protein